MNLQRGRGYITNAGKDLLAYCQTGAELHFTRASIGDGLIETGAQLLAMEKLVHETRNVNLLGIKPNGDGTSTITISIDNYGVTKGFEMREVGIFAQDPRKGEILYAVLSYEDYPDYISSDVQELTEILIDVIVVVSNVDNITINIDRSHIWATQMELIDLAGIGRTNQTVKGNWDLIQDMQLKILMLITRLNAGVSPGSGGDIGGDIGVNDPKLFKVAFPLSESEEWDGIYDAENRRLIA